MLYGFGYMGSKNFLAKEICALFPKKKHFYDLFCGGCAITHRMLELDDFETYTVNDIQKGCVELFRDAINGKYKDEKRWISRDDFFTLKDSDPYVRFCWSFGNDGRTYLYGRCIESWKKAIHYARVLNDYSLLKEMGIDSDGSRIDIKNHAKEYKEKYIAWYKKNHDDIDVKLQKYSLDSFYHLDSLQRLQSLESLQRLQRLQSLESLEKKQREIDFHNKDYSDIEILQDSVIYCDIPYENTRDYNNEKGDRLTDFDFDRFYNWCSKQTELVFVSSYNLPSDKFFCIKEINRNCTFSRQSNTTKVTERVFVPIHQKEMYNETMKNNNEHETDLFLDNEHIA